MERVIVLFSAVKNQVFGNFRLFRRDLVQGHDAAGMEDGASHAPFHGMVEKDRVEHMASRRVDPERDVGKPQNNLTLGQFPGNLFDGVGRHQRQLAVVLVSGADSECEGVDEQVRRRQAVMGTGEIMEAAGHGQFFLHRLGHAFFVDGERNQAGTETPRQLHPCARRLLTVLEID